LVSVLWSEFPRQPFRFPPVDPARLHPRISSLHLPRLHWTYVHRNLIDARSRMLAQGVLQQPEAPSQNKPAGKKSDRPPPMPLPHISTVAALAAADTAVSIPASSTLHSSIDRLWQRARQHLTQPTTSAFLRAESLQSASTTQIEQRIYRDLHLRSNPYRRTLLTAVGSSHASNFLQALPTSSSYRMRDTHMRLACRHRLGLLPYDTLHHHHCVCRSNAGPRFLDDPA
jgi:hypothetical protein